HPPGPAEARATLLARRHAFLARGQDRPARAADRHVPVGAGSDRRRSDRALERRAGGDAPFEAEPAGGAERDLAGPDRTPSGVSRSLQSERHGDELGRYELAGSGVLLPSS